MPLPEINQHAGAYSLIFRDIADSDGVSEACSAVRDRLVTEWQNNAMVQSLLLGMVVAMVLAPPDASDPDNISFRVYMYGSALSTLFLTTGVLLDVILLYQINMMNDATLQRFIVWMGRFRLPGTSPTGLPDILQIITQLGCATYLVALCAAFHTLVKPTDAWVLTAISIALAALLCMFVGGLDKWKWDNLKRVSPQDKASS